MRTTLEMTTLMMRMTHLMRKTLIKAVKSVNSVSGNLNTCLNVALCSFS